MVLLKTTPVYANQNPNGIFQRLSSQNRKYAKMEENFFNKNNRDSSNIKDTVRYNNWKHSITHRSIENSLNTISEEIYDKSRISK